ncbi:hypothetical protein LY78DRAFT_202885 [Colletotrichum sublineola]|nr:hypothetical protein LY78DRAFT_202885 [Colletotrichum sublineola]
MTRCSFPSSSALSSESTTVLFHFLSPVKTPLFSASTSYVLFDFLHASLRARHRSASRLSTLSLGNVNLSSLVNSSALHRRRPVVPISSHLARQQKSVQVPERARCDAQEPLRPATTMPLAASDSEKCLPMHINNMPTQSGICTRPAINLPRADTHCPGPGSTLPNARASSLRKTGSRPGLSFTSLPLGGKSICWAFLFHTTSTIRSIFLRQLQIALRSRTTRTV